MASVVSQLAEVRSARFDIEQTWRASIWSDYGQSTFDWSHDADMMVISLDGDGKVTRLNEQAQEVTGFGQKEIVGYNFARHLISQSLAGLVEMALQKALEGKDVGCFQIPFFTKFGKKVLLFVSLSGSPCGSSKHLLLQAVTADNLARRRPVDDSATMIVKVDVSGHVKEWDVGAQQLTGYTRSDMMGKDFVSTVIPAHAQETLESAFVRALAGQERHLVSAIPLCTRAGTYKWLQLRIIPQYWLSGEMITEQLAGVVFSGRVAFEPHQMQVPEDSVGIRDM